MMKKKTVVNREAPEAVHEGTESQVYQEDELVERECMRGGGKRRSYRDKLLRMRYRNEIDEEEDKEQLNEEDRCRWREGRDRRWVYWEKRCGIAE